MIVHQKLTDQDSFIILYEQPNHKIVHLDGNPQGPSLSFPLVSPPVFATAFA